MPHGSTLVQSGNILPHTENRRRKATVRVITGGDESGPVSRIVAATDLVGVQQPPNTRFAHGPVTPESHAQRQVTMAARRGQVDEEEHDDQRAVARRVQSTPVLAPSPLEESYNGLGVPLAGPPRAVPTPGLKTVRAVFHLPGGYGAVTAHYHLVKRLPAHLLLAVAQGEAGAVFFPYDQQGDGQQPPTEQMAVRIDGADRLFLLCPDPLLGASIRFDDRGVDYCLVAIAQERPLPEELSRADVKEDERGETWQNRTGDDTTGPYTTIPSPPDYPNRGVL